jgi:hypothetical protein
VAFSVVTRLTHHWIRIWNILISLFKVKISSVNKHSWNYDIYPKNYVVLQAEHICIWGFFNDCVGWFTEQD